MRSRERVLRLKVVGQGEEVEDRRLAGNRRVIGVGEAPRLDAGIRFL